MMESNGKEKLIPEKNKKITLLEGASAVPRKVISKRPDGSRRIQIFYDAPSLTKQSFKKECDINEIVRKAAATGILPAETRAKIYADFSDPMDYQTALNTVMDAQVQFENLPSKVREQFNNDPTKFLEFATNPENGTELVKMGLAIPRKPESDPNAIQANTEALNQVSKAIKSQKSKKEEE